MCVIIDTTRADLATKEVRNYVISELPNYFKAVAFFSKSSVGQIVSALMCMEPSKSCMENHTRLPMEIFSEEEAARTWLKQYI